jgi:hypothetical protein
MRRRARANFLTRRQIDPLLLELKVSSADGWPPHLKGAYKLLRGELAIPDETTRLIIVAAVSAAHVCAKAIDQRVGSIVEFHTRNKLCTASERIVCG